MFDANFSAKAWAEGIIAIAEGRKPETAEVEVAEVKTVNPMVGHAMEIQEGFSAGAWAKMMLARAARAEA